jgi:hypothetical protein
MAVDNDGERIRAVWQGQTDSSLTPDDIRKGVEKMEKTMRRSRYGLYVALTLSAAVVVAIAVLFANTLLIAGAAATLCGFGLLAYEMLNHRRRAPAADDGNITSIEYHSRFTGSACGSECCFLRRAVSCFSLVLPWLGRISRRLSTFSCSLSR